MKQLKHLNCIILIIGSLSLISCDPAQILTLRASPESSICLYGDSFVHEMFESSNSDSIKVNICAPFTDSVVSYENSIYFGIGTWTEYNIDQLAEHVDSIVIESSKMKKIYSEQEEIMSYLKNNVRGLLNNEILLESITQIDLTD